MLAFALVVVVGTLIAGNRGADRAAGRDGDGGGRKVRVVAGFYPFAEAAEKVGGSRVDVTNLTPAGTEPHDLELDPEQVADIEDADVVLYMGKGFQPAVAEVARRQDHAVDLATAVPLEKGDGSENGSDVDPHFWLDPQLMAKAVDRVERALAQASPPDAAKFRANAAAYRAELAGLDHAYATGLASCRRDEIVTSHAAFHYLARRYGLKQLAVTGLSPEAEPDPDRLAGLVDRIEADHVTTVFYEELVSPDVARTLARDAHVRAAVLNPLEGLTRGEVRKGADYVSVMRENLAALRTALGCS